MFNGFFDSFYFTALIIASVCCVIFFKALQKPFALIAVLIWMTLINEVAAHFASYNKAGNAIVYNLFTPVEFLFYVLIFKEFLNNRKWSIIVFCCFGLLIIQEVISAGFFYSINHDQFVETIILENVLLVFLSLSLFLKIRTSTVSNNLLLEGVFWFNSVVLFYYGYNVIFWSLFGQSQNEMIDAINFFLSGILYLIYTFSIFLNYLNVIRK